MCSERWLLQRWRQCWYLQDNTLRGRDLLYWRRLRDLYCLLRNLPHPKMLHRQHSLLLQQR